MLKLTTVVKSLEYIDPSILMDEPLAGLGELAQALGAEGIARDARRFETRTRLDLARPGTALEVEAFRQHVFEQLCVRLHHHVERMWQSLAWTNDEQASQVHSLTICRLLCESVLERCGDAYAAAKIRLARWLSVERTKFLMGTIADARAELAFDLATTIGQRHVERFRRRIRAEVSASITSASRATLRELYAAFGDLARSVPDLMFALLDIEGLSLHSPAAPVGAVDMDARRVQINRDAHDVLIALLEDGSQQAVETALAGLDAARGKLEHRSCELLEDALAATKACISFAHTAHQAGPSRPEEVRRQLRSWAARLDRLIARLPRPG
ncbi:MAG: hypothetical protein HOV81_22050 [Kofleriaceae bacterium]|nr:hypothetical protein [Kofleriaceae bacterium]